MAAFAGPPETESLRGAALVAAPTVPEEVLMVVSQIMSADPLCVSADTSVSVALATLDEHDFRHLPVLDGKRLVGLVSERDLLEATGWVPGRSQQEDALAGERPTLVREVMAQKLAVSRPEVPLQQAVESMTSSKIGCLLVTDREGGIVGILTERDVAEAFALAVENRSIPAGDDPEVGSLMSGVLICAAPHTSIQDACSTCYSAKVRHLPVVKDGELVGVVSDRDLRAASTSGTQEALTVADLMATQVETINTDSRLSQAARRIADVAISSLPVVDNGRLVGIVTTFDVLNHACKVLPR